MALQNKEIYRKAALDRLSSPEQLDTLVTVIPGNAWFALGALGLLVSIALVWGWFGSIPTTVESQGIIISRNGLVTVNSNAEGRLSEVYVGLDDRVQVGDRIARIAQPDLALELSKAEGQRVELKARKAALVELHSRSDRLTSAALVQKREALENELEAALDNARVTKELAASKNELLQKAIILRTDYLDTVRLQVEAELRAASVRSEIKQLEVSRLESERRNRAEIVDLETQINSTERTIDGLKDTIARNAIIVSPFAGRVVEVQAEGGALIATGNQLVTLEEDPDVADRLQVLVYPTTADGKKIKPGMEARVTPTTVKREESGFMLGEIVFVSDYTVSREGMMQELQTESLVEQFSAMAPPIKVRAKLLTRPGGKGFLWSSEANEPPVISSGTLAMVEIVVKRQRPLSLVIPLLKKTAGLD
ncbi:MAG: NHLP bacteriocin system secretion protein [bacterium]|nr:NHLP bacteriocin system secretion protein [bacterium]